MLYITGDTHGNFSGVYNFCNTQPFTPERDALIILGDAGLNYYGDGRDMALKTAVSRLPLLLLCIHGNHEMRPEGITTYEETTWQGGAVYVEAAHPNILFAKDGEVFELNGIRAIAIGGAYSVDKYYRLSKGYRWFEDEQPSEEIRRKVENTLDSMDWKIDTVLSHTCPLKYEPAEVFIQGVDQSTVDKSTERWLDSVENKLTYNRWFCGHYHTEKQIDKLQFLYHGIQEF